MTFIAACSNTVIAACMEVRGVSHITIGFHTKPTVIGLHHCQFHYKTDSNGHHQCWFCFKTGSDVSAPYKKEPPGTYTHAPSLHSHFSVSHTLTSHSFHSTWFGHGFWIFHCRYIYVLLSHIVAMYICIVDLYLFSLRYFTWHIIYIMQYIFLFIFLEFY